MQEGERQVAETIDGIRRDHVARYEWASGQIKAVADKVIDCACGVGYGSSILAEIAHSVLAIDANSDAIEYARQHYAKPEITYRQADASFPLALGNYDVAVCFETVEHIEDPRELLRSLRRSAKKLFVSVPNEDEFPFQNHAFHFRHYTKDQLIKLLRETGWRAIEWYGQEGPESEVEIGDKGRTLIAVCDHLPPKTVVKITPRNEPKAPDSVAILGLGPSVTEFLEIGKRNGGRSAIADEVWGINAIGDVIECDRVFHMDDVRIQEIRAKANQQSNIANMLKWLKTRRGPIYTSRPHPDYPGLVAYPLEDVINNLGVEYMNSTAAHAVAFAIHIGVKRIVIFGNDFTYPNAHDAEKGRACVEFWLGMAKAKGIQLQFPKSTSLMDCMAPRAERLYGYDTVDIHFEDRDGVKKITFTEREEYATAEEIEARYDHSVHPNPLVRD